MAHGEEYADAFMVALSRWKDFLRADEDDPKYEYIMNKWLWAAEDFQKVGGDHFEIMRQ